MSTTSARWRRHSLLAEHALRTVSDELDVVDKGDCVEIQSSSADVAAWWMGVLRAMYPQDHTSIDERYLKLHPEMGVTLKLDRRDGTLTVKGKQHLHWFQKHFEDVMSSGQMQLRALRELGQLVDGFLHIDDGVTLSALLEHIPSGGAARHSPTFVYRLWRGLLDNWLAQSGQVYVVTPLLDAKRLADLILILAKHKVARSRAFVHTNVSCDGDVKYAKVLRTAKEMVVGLRSSTKRRLIVDDRLHLALSRITTKFGNFRCKMLAWSASSGYTELLLTSASFHGLHFAEEQADTVLFLRLHSEEFHTNYLTPLGLTPAPAEQEAMDIDTPIGYQPAGYNTRSRSGYGPGYDSLRSSQDGSVKGSNPVLSLVTGNNRNSMELL